MKPHILLAYATRAGSTEAVAQAIAQEITAAGAAVDVQVAKQVKDLSPYQAVIVGSAIRAGNWLGEAKKFVETHQAALHTLPVAFFTVCLTLHEDTPEHRAEVMAYMDPICEMVQPVSKEAFAGVMDFSKLSFPVRTLVKSMKSPEGDFRNWDAIRAWARDVTPLLVRA